MHQRHVALADQPPKRERIANDGGRHREAAAWVCQHSPDDAHAMHHHLDPGRLEIGAERAVLRDDNQRPVSVRVKAGGDQLELAVRAVAARRGVDVQNGARAQTATVNASPGDSGTSSGCRTRARSSSPSTIRGPGREK